MGTMGAMGAMVVAGPAAGVVGRLSWRGGGGADEGASRRLWPTPDAGAEHDHGAVSGLG